MLSSTSENMTEQPTFLKNNTILSEWVEKGNVIDKGFEDYKIAIARTVDSNLELLGKLPPLRGVSIQEIREFLKKTIEESLKKDQVFEKQVEIRRYASDMGKHLESYFSEIFAHHKQIKKEMTFNILNVCRMFFNSDLPLSFLKANEAASLIQKDYLDVFDKQISKEHVKLLTYRNNRRKFENLCDQHNRWIQPFADRLDKIESAQVKLIWYVDFSNSASVKELFDQKTFKSNRLDMKALQTLIDETNRLVEETSALIEPYLEFSPFLSYDEGSSARAIRKIMELLQT